MNNTWNDLISSSKKFELNKGLTSFINPYSMLQLQEKKLIVKGVDHWYVDGISLVWLFNSFFKKNIIRFSFDDTSIAPIVYDFAKKNNLSIAVIGTTQTSVEIAVEKIEKKYGVQISYFRNGYFKNSNDLDNTINDIINHNIDIVICGMGTINQERFLINLKQAGWDGYGYTCGGYLHQSAKRIIYYPKIIDTFNLRWLYRIYDEPKLWKRYAISYPIFFLKFLRFSFFNKATRSTSKINTSTKSSELDIL